MAKGRDGVATKIFPDRIEKAISKNELVALCCVIGVPDEVRINYPVAFVVLQPYVWDKEKASMDIMALCRKELPDYMVPEKIEFRNNLPRTARGKIDFRQLEIKVLSQSTP